MPAFCWSLFAQSRGGLEYYLIGGEIVINFLFINFHIILYCLTSRGSSCNWQLLRCYYSFFLLFFLVTSLLFQGLVLLLCLLMLYNFRLFAGSCPNLFWSEWSQLFLYFRIFLLLLGTCIKNCDRCSFWEMTFYFSLICPRSIRNIILFRFSFTFYGLSYCIVLLWEIEAVIGNYFLVIAIFLAAS